MKKKKKIDLDKHVDRIWDGMEAYMNRKEKL